MAQVSELRSVTMADRLAGLMAADGSAHRAHVPGRAEADHADAARALADAVHYLSMLHARHPGVIDLAALRPGAEAIRPWFEQASRGFDIERLYLTRLMVAAGPVPATPGQGAADAAVAGQRGAIELLARSDRAGCAIGAALALVYDWHAIRPLLDAAAMRFDVALQPQRLPDMDDTLAAAETAVATPAMERAILFGAGQLAAQHRHLWDLLDTRRSVRQQ